MSAERVTFVVRGIPAPQGSKRIVPSGRGGRGSRFHTVESSKRLPGWRSDVRDAAIAAITWPRPVEGPIAVELTFRVVRPKGDFLPANGRRPAPVLKPSAPIWPSNGSDIDKYARAVLDALTGLAWLDDSQVVDLGARKRYADGEGPGVTVTVADLSRRHAIQEEP